jgi:glutamate--cysteine ligase
MTLIERLREIPALRLKGMRRGVEKESLRCDARGALALTPHPLALGSALTHPSITTDFSESQLEFITGAHRSPEEVATELRDIHHFVLREIGAERLWPASMPCQLPADENIPIGQYGTSNIGRAKSVYRMGLTHRYGRRMQTICGIHYNWSLPGVGTDGYFALMRNFRRQSFLLLLLFGASPAVCASFVDGRTHDLQRLGNHSYHLPHATSLRMGRLGYQSEAQASLAVSFNGLDSYARTLHGALTTRYPAYEALGVRNPGGEYNQLSTTLLQIENEFYGTIRPKRRIKTGERPLRALRERGVEYIEVRCMDLDPFEPLGIGLQTMRFLDVFLLHCLLADSPPDTPAEVAALARNQQRVATRGREPGAALERNGGEVSIEAWAREIVEQCRPIAARLDAVFGGAHHLHALEAARQRLHDPGTTPSARVLAAMKSDFGDSFAAFGRARADEVRATLLAEPASPAALARLRTQARESVAEQRRREAAETMPFEAFRQQYLAPEQLGV